MTTKPEANPEVAGPARIPWLRKVTIFQNLSESSLDQVAKIAHPLALEEPEQVIFEAGAVADALYIIVSGQIRIDQNYRNGRRKTLAFISEGHFFGEMAIITAERRCATAVTSTKARLLRIEKADFLKCLKINSELCFSILQVLCDRLRTADAEIGNLTFRNLPGRIVYKLLELADQFGEPSPEGTLIKLSLTHYDLADMVGTNRESVSKYLSKFRKEGSLKNRRKHFILSDRRKLLAWA